MACNLFTFIDDERVVAPDEELCWQACHVLAFKQSYLEIMDAPRKYRLGSQPPRAWAGAVVHILMILGVCALTSEEKRKRLKALLAKWLLRLKAGVTELLHKELASDRGIMVYVTHTYPPMVPYLKGFHLAMEMWRGGRDSEGYKLRSTRKGEESDDESTVESIILGVSLYVLDATRAGDHGADLDWASSHDVRSSRDEEEFVLGHNQETPENVIGKHAPLPGLTPTVPRLKKDIESLVELTKLDLPALRVV